MANSTSHDFYLTCVSNASCDIYPNNTQSDFKNLLPEPLNLPNHEIAIVEFSFSETWLNVQKKFTGIIVSKDVPNKPTNNDDKPTGLTTIQKNIEIEKGFYPTNMNFFTYINKKIKELDDDWNFLSETFEYKPVRQKVTVKVPPGVTMLMNKEMCEISGFTPDAHIIGDFRLLKNNSDTHNTVEADWVADVHMGLYTFFIYSDLVSPQIVGNVKVPLLRTVPIKQRRGVEQVTKTFIQPHYLPLAKSYIQSVEILIRDDTGNPISFQKGKCLVKLHIRPRAPRYL